MKQLDYGHSAKLVVLYTELAQCNLNFKLFHPETHFKRCISIYIVPWRRTVAQGDVYIIPERVSFRYEFTPVPTCSSAFVYMKPVRSVVLIRVIPVRVHSGSHTGSKYSHR